MVDFNATIRSWYFWILSRGPKGGRHECSRGAKAEVAAYCTNPDYLQNPIFSIGCFELMTSKIFATAFKIGKNYFIVANFFCGIQFFAELIVAHKGKIFFAGVFGILEIGVYSFCCHCKRPGVPWTLGLQSIPTRQTNVDQLDSGIAVHSTDKHQQASVSADSGTAVFQRTRPKLIHNSAHGT